MHLGHLLTPSLLGSRFGRRLLLLFVLCSLLPTLALALLSFATVTRQLRHASMARLEHSAGLLGDGIRERLELLADHSAGVAVRSEPCPVPGTEADGLACDGSLDYGFSALAFTPSAGKSVPLFGELAHRPLPSRSEREQLRAGRTLILDRQYGAGSAVYMIRAVPRGGGWLIGQIDPNYLWGYPDQLPLVPTMDFQVVNARGAVVSERGPASHLPEVLLKRIDAAPTGSFEWSLGDQPYLAFHRAFSAPPAVIVPRWTLIVSETRAAVLAPMRDFTRTFPLVIALSLGAAIVLSLSQLHRNLAPLQALHEGTRRVSRREFDARVEVTSRDEFAEVAASFNSMADQIRRQFTALATAADIDRAVLSSVDTNRIVRTVLERMPDVCPGHLVGITLMDPAGAEEVTTFVVDAGEEGMGSWTGRLGPGDRERLAGGNDRLEWPAVGAPDFVAPLRDRGVAGLLVFPLRYQGELYGAILLADGHPSARVEEDLVQAQRVAGQVALALSNARMVDQIKFLAFYDSLTGLPNRISFKRRLAVELDRSRRAGGMLAVCFLDLDFFSRINDTLGHKIGDRLVQEVGRRVRDRCAAIAPEASVARLGGDEFTIILPGLRDPSDATRLARRVLESFDVPFALDGHEVFVSTSIGVAIRPADGDDLESLLKNADVAMYEAKRKGRNRVELYADSMGINAVRRLALENNLRKAMEDGDFVVWYQPIADLATGRIASAEALIRWQHPEWGTVPPSEFIHVCEESGLIVPVGEWILQTVCEQNKAWQREGLLSVPVAINISGQQLRNDATVGAVRRVLAATGLEARFLVLELTESVLMHGEGEASAALQALAGLGVGVAVDDFGTGYSSLSYLKHFPVTSLKIDQSFIHDLSSNPDDAAITSAIIAMASALGLLVVAEGVEREDQLEFLIRQGCDRVQGYLVGRPVPAQAFRSYLAGDGVIPALRPAPSSARRRRRAG